MGRRACSDALMTAIVKLFLGSCGRFILWEAMNHKRTVTFFGTWQASECEREGGKVNLNFSGFTGRLNFGQNIYRS